MSTVGAVVRDGKEHPVAYNSRKLSSAERNYCATELEGLAVVASIQHFAVYLHGMQFMVEKDHLSFLQTANLQNSQLA